MVRTTRRDQGISMILVVILIVITLGLVVWSVGLWAQYKQMERQSALLKKIVEVQIPQEESDIKLAIVKATEASGIPLTGEGLLDVWEGAEAFDVLPSSPYPEMTSDEALKHGAVLADFAYEERP